MQTNLIIGATGGIGKAIAEELVKTNTKKNLVLTGRNKTKLQKLKTAFIPTTSKKVLTSFQSCTEEISFHFLNVCNEKSVQNFFKKIKIKYIDNLFYCVGETAVLPTYKQTLIDWNKIINTNLTGAFLIYKYSYNLLKEDSNLIFISSIAVRDIFPDWTAYTVSKSALNKFCDCIREELRPKKVKVTCVIPAATNTNLWDKVNGNWNKENMLNTHTVARIILKNLNDDNAVTEEIIIRSTEGNL